MVSGCADHLRSPGLQCRELGLAQALQPGHAVVPVGTLVAGIRIIQGMGHGAVDGPVGDAEHGFLETHADFDVDIHHTPPLAPVCGLQRGRKVAVHVLHQQTGGDTGPHGGQGVCKEGPIGKLALVVGNPGGLGVEREGAQEGHPPQKDGFHIGDRHIHQKGELGILRQDGHRGAMELHRIANRQTGCGHKPRLHKLHNAGDGVDPPFPVGTGQIQEQVTHDPPELPQGMGGGGGADQLRQELGEEGAQQSQQGIMASLEAGHLLADTGKAFTLQEGIQPAGAMPEHGLLAVLRIFKINAIMAEMTPQSPQAELTVEKPEDRKGIEELLFPLVDQVAAVGIQHLPIAFQYTHHLQHMGGGFIQQRHTIQQPLQQGGEGIRGQISRHGPPPPGRDRLLPVG